MAIIVFGSFVLRIVCNNFRVQMAVCIATYNLQIFVHHLYEVAVATNIKPRNEIERKVQANNQEKSSIITAAVSFLKVKRRKSRKIDEQPPQKKKLTKVKKTGLLRALGIANIMFMLNFILLWTLSGLVHHIYFQAEESDFLVDIWSRFLGEAADVETMVLFVFPATFVGLDIFLLYIRQLLKITKAKFAFLSFSLMLIPVMACRLLDSYWHTKPILMWGNLYLLWNLFFVGARGVALCLPKRKVTPKTSTWLLISKKLKWITDLSSEISGITYFVYVEQPLVSIFGDPDSDKKDSNKSNDCEVAGFLKMGKREKRDKNDPKNYMSFGGVQGIFKAILFAYIQVPGLSRNGELNVIGFVLAVVWRLYDHYAGVDMGLSMLVFLAVLAQVVTTTSQVVATLIAIVITLILTQSVLYLYTKAKKKGWITKKFTIFPQDTKALKKVVGKFLHVFTVFSFGEFTVFVFVLAGLSCFNAAACLVVPNNSGAFAEYMEIIIFFAVFEFSIFLCQQCFTQFVGTNNNFSSEISRFMATVLKVSGAKEQKKNKPDLGWCRECKKKTTKPNKFFEFLGGQVICTIVFGLALMSLRSNVGQHAAKVTYAVDEDRFRLFDLNLARDNIDHEYVKLQRDSKHYYLGCSLKWQGLSALDHAVLSQMAYFQAESDAEDLEGFKQALKFAFPESLGYNVTVDEDWRSPQRKQDIHNGLFSKYYKIDFHHLKHTVIAVQGTDPGDLADVLTDLRLWLVSLMMDFLERVIPSLNLLLPRQRADLQGLIDSIQQSLTLNEEQLDAHIPVVNYVHDLLHDNPSTTQNYVLGYFQSEHSEDSRDWTISVTGHSLGGGIATVVGSTLGIPSVSFSGPGFFYSKWQFATPLRNGTVVYPKLSRAMNYATTFIPSHDIVPQCDRHLGTVQYTTCSRKGALSCHAIDAMVCDLLVQCGDGHDQKRFHSCKIGYDLTFDEEEREETLN